VVDKNPVKKDNKKLDKVKEVKKVVGKKEETEKKKEIYFETFETKLCDSVVTNITLGHILVRLWAIGDIQVINTQHPTEH